MDKDGTDDYVTIVSVGNGEGQHVSLQDTVGQGAEVPFVTVLSIGQRPAEEEVIIYRLPGEKLGFGLKFEGGTKSSECVRRLFIQSCAADSPAGRALAAWGPLQPGDEIVHIDNLSVTNLTRLECVRRLKDSNVAVSLLVRHDPLECALEAEPKTPAAEDANRVEPTPIGKLDVDKASLPPPVPPRKLNRKNANSSSDKQNNLDSKKSEVKAAADGVAAEIGLAKKAAVGKQSPGRPRRFAPSPALSAPPLEAQVYTDLFCQEKEHSILVAESESDDTGSSISTVIDRLSVYSSFPGSVENSIPSTPTLGYKQLNFQNVFSCLDNIGNSLIADVPPSVVEENTKILAKSSNGAALSEKVVVVLADSSVPNEINKKDIETPAPVLSLNKANELSTQDTSNIHAFECQISDSNNNKSIVKDINTINSQAPSKSRDAEDCPGVNEKLQDKVASMEAPKPKPRNMSKKYTENTFSARQYDENLSLTKLHCIESWLQDSISCKNAVDEPAYVREDDNEVIRPEALPRLIDFVPKTHVFKIQPDALDSKDKPTSPPHLKSENDSSKDDTNHLRLIITRDPCQDWCNSGGSPQLETIYEDLSTCPTLLIEETSRHPPAGDSGSDQGTQVSIGPPKDSEANTPELKGDLIVHNKDNISRKRQESEECGGVSRGPRPPPDGRENPLVHHDDLPPSVPLLAHFHREAPITVTPVSNKTNTPHPKDTKRFELGNRSVHDSRSIHESPRRMIKTSEKSYGRGKDAKSEGSVKDKIAMFSVNKTAPPEPNSFTGSVSAMGEKRHSISNNNIRGADAPSHYASLNRSYSVQAEPVSKTYDCKEWHTLPKKIELERPLSESYISDTYVRDYAPITKPTQVPEAKLSPIALLNIALNATPAKSDIEKNNSHKSTLDHLIEQRRKSMSKLRGLVIPESPRVANLPEIKSRDSLKISSSSRGEEDKCSTLRPDSTRAAVTASASLISLWDSQPIINTIPKYSPAFKRKSLQVYGPKTSKTLDLPKYTENSDSLSTKRINKSMDLKGPVPVKPPRTSLDIRRPYDHREFAEKMQTLPPSFKAPSLPGPLSSHLTKSKYPELIFSDAVESPTFRMLKNFPETADSDDSSYLSTVSSPTPSLNTVDNTESDCSSHCTLSQKNEKKISKASGLFDYGLHHAMYQPENDKNNVCRSLSSDTSTSAGSSNSSTLTSGSQASCSSAGSTDTGSHRVLKPRSIEAINRKNILASAKCRSGKDNKFGSPLIERKFSDVESTDDEKKTKRVESQYSKARSDGGLANSILKVAYSTVVEDKSPMNETDSTYSDTESDCDFGSVTLTKADLNQSQPKYTNGSSLNSRKANDINFNRRSNDIYAKSTPEPAKVNRTVENGPPKNNIEVARNVISHANFEESTAEVYPIESKKYEYESYEVSSCGVSEDEQDNWCEVRLSRGASGGVGVTLAGGADCEAKQVTIHKVLQGSAAERDGRLRKGDKVISINGHTMKGVTHAQSVAILKEQLPEVSIVVCGKRTAENPLPEVTNNDSTSSVVVSIVLHKADDTPGGAGLGISLQGGGNRPLLINKLFTGGAAANSGRIESGSELVAAGGARLAGLTRTQAWGLLRALPAGPVTLLLRPP